MTDPHAEPSPPLGSWARVYALAVVMAVLVMVVLYLLTEAYDLPLEAR